MQIFRAPNQLGLPTSMNTDSKLGWSVYTYMSPEILLDKCEGTQSILLRIEGFCSKGHDAVKELAQRAKAGLRPCCAVATHVLIPPIYPAGRLGRKKLNSTSLWQRLGPFATRNYAAAAYFNANGELPSTWDWLASKHLVKLPDPLNAEDCRKLGEGASHGDNDDAGDSTPGTQSSLPASGIPHSASQTKKFPKPPPPIHPNVASPSPGKSQGTFKGSPSRGSSSWVGEWHSARSQPWDWNHRRWR